MIKLRSWMFGCSGLMAGRLREHIVGGPAAPYENTSMFESVVALRASRFQACPSGPTSGGRKAPWPVMPMEYVHAILPGRSFAKRRVPG